MESALKGLGIVVLSLVGFGLLIGICLLPDLITLSSQDDVVITIQDKERIMDRSGSGSRYLIWSEEGEVFENTDQMLMGKFNSSDLYGKLEKGKTYQCHVSGWRNEFMRWYRNLIRCEEKSEL